MLSSGVYPQRRSLSFYFKVLAITWASITKDNTIAMLTPVTYVCVNFRDIVNDDRISSSRGDEAESDGRLRADVFKRTNKTLVLPHNLMGRTSCRIVTATLDNNVGRLIFRCEDVYHGLLDMW